MSSSSSLPSMYKAFISWLTLLSILGSMVPIVSANGTVDFNVKLSSSGDETYDTTLSNVSYFNTDITFQFVEVSSWGATEYSLNLPTGFVYQSHNTTGNACAAFVVQNASNNNYHFSFNGAVGCLAKTEFTYRVTNASTPWSQGIFVLLKNGSSWSNAADVTIGVTSTNSITQAVTADLNANGYADAYRLSFATLSGVTANALSWVTVAWATVGTATASGSTWILPFSDNVLWSGDTPQIAWVFDGVTLSNGSVSETDGAAPRIMTIASTSTVAATINIGTGVLTMTVSEPLAPSSTGAFSFQLGTGAIAWGFTLTGNLSTLIFTPAAVLLPGTYTLANTSSATDWSAGANILAQTFPGLIVPDITPPGTGSILINAGAATTTSQTVALTLSGTDNIGVTQMMVSNSPTFVSAVWEAFATTKAGWLLTSSALGAQTVYVKYRDAALNESPVSSASITIVSPPPSGGGGGWGGWGGGGSPSPDYCPNGDLSGNFYDNKCSAPTTGSGTTTSTGSTASGTTTPSTPVAPWIPGVSGSPSDISAGSLNTKYFTSFAEARKYLLERISHRAIVKLINTYGDRLTITDEAYFLSVDPTLYPEYNKVINAYVLLFMRVQDAVSGNRSASVKSDGRLAAGIVTSGITLVKNLLDRYVTRTYIAEKNITLYRTKNAALTKPLTALENKVIKKFDALLSSDTISRSEYETAVQGYNDFVLHLMIYRDYGKTTLSKDRALLAIKVFMATYRKKVGEITLSDELLQKQREYNGY